MKANSYSALIPVLVALLIPCMPPRASGAQERDTTFTVAQLRADFTVLRSALEDNHPALYRYQDKQDFDAAFDSVHALISSEMTEAEFFRLLAPVVAMVNCVHTRISLSDSYGQYAREHYRHFPLGISYVGNRAYLLRHYSADTTPPAGSEVLAINGVSAQSLLREFLAEIPSDGHNQTSILHFINRRSFARISRALGYPTSYQVDYLGPGETASATVTVEGLPYDAIMSALEERYPRLLAGPRLGLEIIDSLRAAVLTIGTLYTNPASRFHEFLDSSFASIEAAGIATLIVDVRGNYGGHPDNAVNLLRYVADSAFTYFAPEVGNALTRPVSPYERNFQGDRYFLIDGGSLSTTGHLLSIAKYHGLGTFVGEESGATFSSNDNSLSFTLPNTRLVGRVARTTFETAVTGLARERGIQPDYVVTPTVGDLLAGDDVVLEYVIRLVSERRRGSRP